MSERIDLQAAASRALKDLDWVGARFVLEAQERNMPALGRLDLDDAELLAIGRHRMRELLEHLARGDRAGYLATVIARYEDGETTGQRGLGKEGLSLADLVQALTAQKLAFLGWVGRQPFDGASVAAIAIELEHLYADIEAAYAQTHAQIQKDFVQRLTDHTPAAIAFLDRALVFRWINPAFTELTGWPHERVIDKTLVEVAHDFDWQGTVGRQLLEATAPVRFAGVPYAPDALGALRYWDVTWVPMHDDGDRLAGYLLLALDASERVENERLQAERIEALEETDRLKDQFLSILSHELRTPINAIMGFGSILDDELLGPLSTQQHHYLQRMLAGGDHLLNLVNDLLDMSRIQAGKFTISLRPEAFLPLAEEVLHALRPLADQKGQRLEATLSADLPPLPMDAQRVSQVLTNLVGNAIKFTPEGGHVHVRARRDGDHLRVEVADTGPGILPADQAKLFQPFSQVDMSATRAARGTGLGLSIVKALVEAHGGSVGLESVPGRGSTFWFTLPILSDRT